MGIVVLFQNAGGLAQLFYHKKLRHFYFLFSKYCLFFQSDAIDYLAEVTLLNKIFRSVKKDNSMSFTQDF